ncbi:2,3-diaminopropionate biosynthesis protein SbnB [Streptomyces albireticuli]|uniref:2,3-diaminopropionate biosynthesis protein SbnB n=1 Tax=Streptomyces albireticuli TaxID=1940 RepID=A0A2A2D137_9ACTN|nr:2,3-diaminopropionate biosynthesis protein SbnB [Streptomyces albireticuli]MCD9193497.1 2,3-diaminopropionate biosynthesis protein SbnB [Streptomyces albireticuli]PAU45224.1 2,3-diaminopropionate biosynthesis protein SbnB [Streptomyces albireticuli]
MLVIGNHTVRGTLDGKEHEVLDAVRDAYVAHAVGDTAVPHSVFLRFPADDTNRIIGLPAYLGGGTQVAGMKWISSFPGNVASGLQRASAAIILNSLRTGQPEALIEGSTISARRTAASAALAARTMPGEAPDTGVSLIGCGVINAEVLRFLKVVAPELRTVRLFDLDRARAEAFAAAHATGLAVEFAESADDALGAHRLVSVATTASTPHTGLGHCRPGTLVLHLSLRDLTPEAILGSVNVVDDADHVCRASTSLHLAEQRAGNRDFITAALGDTLATGRPHPRDPREVTVFSPFGLGILDLALANLVREAAEKEGTGVRLTDFLPEA